MTGSKGWSRRNFVQVMGTATLSTRGLCSTLLGGAGSPSVAAALYVGCAGRQTNAIEVFAPEGSGLKRIQRVASERPVAMAVAANGRRLYVANQISQYRGLPRGTVEAYAIGEDGRLTLLNRQELSLAATMPRHLAIAPDGRSLAVTAQGGGVFNTMPIAEDGSVGRASGILKVTGDVEGRPARPRMAIFDRTGRIVSADQGTGQLRVLQANEDGLSPHAHGIVSSGEAPRHIALHHEAAALYVAHESSLECFGYDHETGRVTELRQRVSNAGVADGAKALAVHPAGRLLLACDGERGVASWKIGTDGTLRSAGRHAEELGRLDAMEVARDGASMIAINGERGEIAGAVLDAATGRVSGTRMLARVDSPSSLAVIYS